MKKSLALIMTILLMSGCAGSVFDSDMWTAKRDYTTTQTAMKCDKFTFKCERVPRYAISIDPAVFEGS